MGTGINKEGIAGLYTKTIEKNKIREEKKQNKWDTLTEKERGERETDLKYCFK